MRFVAFLLAFLSLTCHVLADESYLTAAGIKERLVSRTARWENFVPMKGANLTVYLAPQGSMIGVNDDGSLLNTNYWISYKRNQICFGAGACMYVRDDGNDDYALASAYAGDNEDVIAHVIDPQPGDVDSLYQRLRQQQLTMTGKQLASAIFTILLLAVVAHELHEPFSGPTPHQSDCIRNGVDQCEVTRNLIAQADRNREQRSQ